jgi:Tol biopolymer transport system component
MSPDGRWIYFESRRTDHDDDSPAQLWRIRTPGH